MIVDALIAHLRAVGAFVADDGLGAATAQRDMAARVSFEGADDDVDATASQRRVEHAALLWVYLEVAAGRGEADARAFDVAVDLSRRLLADHSLPIGVLDRDSQHAPVRVECLVQLVTMLERGDLAAEAKLGERFRGIAQRLALASADGLVLVAPLAAEVDVFDDDSVKADIRLDLTINPYAGSWPGVRACLVEQLRAEDWRVDDDGWGAAPGPTATFGGAVAGVTITRVAGAQLLATDDEQGLVVLLRAPIITADPE